jgi:hypothetical protein
MRMSLICQRKRANYYLRVTTVIYIIIDIKYEIYRKFWVKCFLGKASAARLRVAQGPFKRMKLCLKNGNP